MGHLGGAEDVPVRGGAASTKASKPVRTRAPKPWKGGQSKGAVGVPTHRGAGGVLESWHRAGVWWSWRGALVSDGADQAQGVHGVRQRKSPSVERQRKMSACAQ